MKIKPSRYTHRWALKDTTKPVSADNGYVVCGARGVTSQSWDVGVTCPACLARIAATRSEKAKN